MSRAVSVGMPGSGSVEATMLPGQTRPPVSFRPAGATAATPLPDKALGALTDELPHGWGPWLDDLRDGVLATMATMPVVAGRDLGPLRQVRIGRMRRTAIWRHGVTRYVKGGEVARRLRAREGGPADVRLVDLHPALAETHWQAYAHYVLFHEYVHCLGWNRHDAAFKSVERTWHQPHAEIRTMAKAFSDHLALKQRPWLWVCPSCDKRHPRAKRSSGRYHCKACMVNVLDVANHAYEG